MFLSKSFYFALFTLSVPVMSNSQNNPVQSGCTAPTTQVIAHRGYWDTHGSAQNSLASLEKADEIGAYGRLPLPGRGTDGFPRSARQCKRHDAGDRANPFDRPAASGACQR